MFIIEEPILGFFAIWETADITEQQSIPHVSGIQIESGLDFANVFEHSIICSTESRDPRLIPILKNYHFERNFSCLVFTILVTHSSISL